jgi:hypothetical protein
VREIDEKAVKISALINQLIPTALNIALLNYLRGKYWKRLM